MGGGTRCGWPTCRRRKYGALDLDRTNDEGVTVNEVGLRPVWDRLLPTLLCTKAAFLESGYEENRLLEK
jgi:hypothetical protein